MSKIQSPAASDQDIAFKPAQAASYLTISRCTLNLHISTGRIKAYNVGHGKRRRSLRIDKSECDAFKERQKAEVSRALQNPLSARAIAAAID